MKVAVTELKAGQGISADTIASINDTIPQALVALGPFEAMSNADIARLVTFEATKDRLGCNDVTCLAEIGAALGVDYLVAGSLILAEGTYVLQLQLLNPRSARVEARSAREYRGGPLGLLEEVRTATKLLVRDVMAEHQGTFVASVSEEGATIRIDGAAVGTSPLPPMSLAGGLHAVAVEREGFIRWTRDVEVRESEETRVDVALIPSSDFRTAYEKRARLVRSLAWSGVAVSVAALGAGATSLLVARSRGRALQQDIDAYAAKTARTQSEQDALDGRRSAIGRLDGITLGCALSGALAAAAAAVLYASGDDPGRYATPPKVSIDLQAGITTVVDAAGARALGWVVRAGF